MPEKGPGKKQILEHNVDTALKYYKDEMEERNLEESMTININAELLNYKVDLISWAESVHDAFSFQVRTVRADGLLPRPTLE